MRLRACPGSGSARLPPSYPGLEIPARREARPPEINPSGTDSQRKRFPTLEAFSPRIIAFFNDQAKRLTARMKDSRRPAPRVVSIKPEDGANDVDPALTQIRIVFDRPMSNGSWSLVGGGVEFPQISGKPAYNAVRTTWTVPIRLKPTSSYRFQLNSQRFHGFQNARGVPLEPVVVQFRTSAPPRTLHHAD